jgi:hypothetical protein
MTLKYRNRPYGPQQPQDPFSRFPRNAQPIATAPAMGSRPIKVFEPSGKAHWAVHHGDTWKVVANMPTADGTRVMMTGDIVRTPVAWASS